MNKTILPFLLIFLLSLPIKFMAAKNMPFDIDIVPVLERNLDYPLPLVGTLSSVAAYNMPMLEWLFLPAVRFIGNAWWAIFLTLIIFNFVGTLAVFRLSADFFSLRVGYAMAALFSFSEVGISSAYTAWAQLLLPTFFAVTLWALWQWHSKAQGRYLALAGIVATAAFMTHFSAVLLYPAMLVFALVNRSKWQWNWLGIGAIAVFLMLSPYLWFEYQRDFVDLRAFLSQKTLVAPENLAAYRPYARQNQTSASHQAREETPAIQAEPSAETPPASRLERGLNYALSLPRLLFKALQAAFPTTSQGLGALTWFGELVFALPMALFWLGLPLALWRRDVEARHYGRLGVFGAVILLLMAITRNLDNVTYLMGFMSLQTVMAGYALGVILKDVNGEEQKQNLSQRSREAEDQGATTKDKSSTRRLKVTKAQRKTNIIVGLMLLFCVMQVGERWGRLLQHDDEVFSAYNVSIYPNISAAVAAIAADWQGENVLTVSYDILPEMPNLWWTPAWNSIDPSYRMGMNFDFLLRYHHGLENSNQTALGTVENANYIVIYAPAAERYNLENYEVWKFGAIWVLKPR